MPSYGLVDAGYRTRLREAVGSGAWHWVIALPVQSARFGYEAVLPASERWP